MSSIAKPVYGSAITGREKDLIIGYDFDVQEGEIINREITGLAGGSDGSVLRGAQSNDRILGSGFRFHHDDGKILSTVSGDTTTAGTMIFTARIWETVAADRDLVGEQTAGDTYYQVFVNNGRLWTRFGTGVAQDSGWDYQIGKAFRIAVTWSAGDIVVYIDGNPIDTYSTTFDTSLGLFNVGGWGLLSYLTIEHEQWGWKLYRRALTPVEIEADYFEFAKRVQFADKLQGLSVTPSSVNSGLIGGSPWICKTSGTVDIVDAVLPHNKNAKAYKATGGSTIYLERQYVDTLNAELSWGRHSYWFKYSGSSGGIFIADSTSIVTGNGYWIEAAATGTGVLNVYEVTSGSFTTLFASVAGQIPLNSWVRIDVDRRYDGQFHVYVNGKLATPTGAYTNPFTDTTHNTAEVITAIIGVGSEFTEYTKTFGHLS